MQISPACFFVFLLHSKLRVIHIRKKLNLKFSFSQKWLQRFSSNFVGLLYIRTPRIGFSRKNSWIWKFSFNFSVWPSPNLAPSQTDQSRSNSISRVAKQISQFIFYSGLTAKIKGCSHKKLKFSFSQKWLQRFPSNVLGFCTLDILRIWHYRLLPQNSWN